MCTFFKPAAAAARWVEARALLTTAKTVVSGLPACWVSVRTSLRERSAKECAHQLADILEADTPGSSNNSVRSHSRSDVVSVLVLVRAKPPVYMSPPFSSPALNSSCSRWHITHRIRCQTGTYPHGTTTSAAKVKKSVCGHTACGTLERCSSLLSGISRSDSELNVDVDSSAPTSSA